MTNKINKPTLAANGPQIAALKEELGRQYSILMKDAPMRLASTTLAYGLASLFVPIWVILTCFAVNLGGEIISLRALKGLDPAAEPGRYRKCLVWVFILEMAFSIVPAMIWHVDGPYMKAFAVGLAVTSVMHVSTVRAIHLPMGLTGFAAIASAALASNAWLWINKGNLTSLGFTTVCAIAGLSYALGAIISNNKLHQETARGRADAQAANAAKGTFLAQMSHELRTPLNAILGMGHAELQRTNDPVSEERLSVLIRSAEGLSTILDDILDMSAIQGGHLPIRRATIALRTELTSTASLFRPQIEAAGLQLVLDLPDSLPDWALLDAQRLRQCLSNLLSNALKNTPSGQITLRARRVVRSGAKPLLRIELSDTGPGIAPDQAAAMFEPFARGPGTSLGTGLGLPITRALAQQMGGDLRLEQPKPGAPSGAHFILTIVLEETFPPHVPIGKSASTLLDLQGMTILVVDDIATNRLVAVTYLQYFGAETTEAQNGAVAVERLSHGGIDIVLLDMNMPEMDGLETYAAMRRLAAPSGLVPVIAMTANTQSDHRRLYTDVGIDGYLAKPVTPDAAAAEIRRVLAAIGRL